MELSNKKIEPRRKAWDARTKSKQKNAKYDEI